MSYIIKYFYNFYSRRHCIYIRKNTKETKQVDYTQTSVKFTAHIYIRKNTKETKQVDYTQISVKIYSKYLYQEEHQGNEASRLHTNFGQNLQHIFILGRTPRRLKRKNENGNNVCNTAHATQQTQSKRRISCRKI